MGEASAIKPENASWVSPFLTVQDPEAAMRFYEKAFGFEQAYANEQDGRVVHAEMKYMGATVLLLTLEGQHEPHMKTPKHSETDMPAVFCVYMKNVDDAFARAISSGATSVFEPKDVPWGERMCQVRDPDGYRWLLSEVVKQSHAG